MVGRWECSRLEAFLSTPLVDISRESGESFRRVSRATVGLMHRLERYLAARVLLPALATLAVLVVVALVYYANRFLAEAVSELLPMNRVAAMSALKLGLLMDTLVPAAMTLGVVIGLGRLQAGQEITAMAAGGFGRRRMLRALAVPTLALTLVAAGLSHVFRPWAYEALYQLQVETRSELGLDKVQAGRFESVNREWVVFAQSRDGSALADVMVHRRLSGSEILLRAEWLREATRPNGGRELILSGNVRAYRLLDDGRREVVGQFERFSLDYMPPPVPGRTQLRRAEPLSALLASNDAHYQAELQWRIVAPASVLILALAGLLLSRVDSRKGQASRVLAASLLVVVWFSLLSVAINWIEAGRLPAWPGALWLPILVLSAMLAHLWRRARRPGPLL